MKHILLLITVLFTASCQYGTHKQYTNKGIVTGIDTTGACGKYILRIYEDSNTSYRFSVFPKGMDPDTTYFPIPVYFNYTETRQCGNIHFVIIKDMERISRNVYGGIR